MPTMLAVSDMTVIYYTAATLSLGVLVVMAAVEIVANRRALWSYSIRKLNQTFVYLPWRYRRAGIHFGSIIYVRICRFVRSWDFWWASITGRVISEPLPISDSQLRPPIYLDRGRR